MQVDEGVSLKLEHLAFVSALTHVVHLLCADPAKTSNDALGLGEWSRQTPAKSVIDKH